ncbi:uncharacterized protein LOC141874285 isoform X1 [Acropora palmata]|uniref:uncharacterized protein LOC141874285 isoform X1 n=1 Tax=Acropora palmata TaxID=6131 RepID=UPI003DA0AED6
MKWSLPKTAKCLYQKKKYSLVTRIQTNLHLVRLQNTRPNMKATAPSHLRRRARMMMLLLHLPKNRSQMQNGQHSMKERKDNEELEKQLKDRLEGTVAVSEWCGCGNCSVFLLQNISEC